MVTVRNRSAADSVMPRILRSPGEQIIQARNFFGSKRRRRGAHERKSSGINIA
jgi:hypothetical protein